MRWIDDLKTALDQSGMAVLVTLARVEGSAPRAAGTKMVVHRNGVVGTIGGGNLEHKVIDQARKMLGVDECGPRLQKYPLGPLLNQCCGGHVSVLLEKVTRNHRTLLREFEARERKPIYLRSAVSGDTVNKEIVSADWVRALGIGQEAESLPMLVTENLVESEDFLLEQLEEQIPHIVLFGSGHVGRALVPVLASLNVTITWVDGRATEFPDVIPNNVTKQVSDDALHVVEAGSSGAIYLVMTYSHDIDYDLVRAILRRGDARYCGLIGSASKRARFVQRMEKDGLTSEQIAGLTCPIGVPGTGGKRPEEIAISVAAQILQVL